MLFILQERKTGNLGNLHNNLTNNPPGHHGREGFVHLWDYPSISMFSPDLSSTVKWSSQTMIRSSHRFTRASPKASKRAGGCLMKVLQLVDAGNLCVSGSSIDRTFFLAVSGV